LSTALPTDSTAFCAPSLTVSFADLPVFRALDDVFLALDDAFERERLAVRVERAEPLPFPEVLPARVDLLRDDPFRDVLLLRVPELRVPEDLEDGLRPLRVLVCAMPSLSY
jgi:hypothetical protein